MKRVTEFVVIGYAGLVTGDACPFRGILTWPEIATMLRSDDYMIKSIEPIY